MNISSSTKNITADHNKGFLINKIFLSIFSIACAGLSIIGIPIIFAQERGNQKSAIEEILSNIKSYQKEIETIRCKQFKSDVLTRVQSMKDFRSFVKNELDNEMPPEKIQKIQMSLIKLGLLPENYDLRKGYENLLLTQAGAYYDPLTKTIYLLKIDSFTPEQLKENLIHELCHALQDQFFDLTNINKKASSSDDSATAVRFLYEGEATYVMTLYSLRPILGEQMQSGINNPFISQIFSRMKFMTRDMLLNQAEAQMSYLSDKYPEIKAAFKGLEEAPSYLFWYLHAPYVHGLSSISDIISYNITNQKPDFQGGWQNIDLAYQNPPVSTEQIIHPRKLLIERDDPTPVNEPNLPPQWEIIFSDTLGEFGFWTLFSTFELPSFREASDGWDGDKYFLIKNTKSNLYGLCLSTVWDSSNDAIESFKAYQSVIGHKYKGWQKEKNTTKNLLIWTNPDKNSAVFASIEGNKWITIEDIPYDELELWKNSAKKD
ncbi:MAG: hypothetical protein V1701_10635 [Planctomycetota bacterium]